MGRGRLWLVVVLLGTGTLAEEDLERDILTEDEEGVVEEDMSLYTRFIPTPTFSSSPRVRVAISVTVHDNTMF